MSVSALIPLNIHYEVVRLKSDFLMSNYLLLCGYFHFLFLRRFVHEFKQYHQKWLSCQKLKLVFQILNYFLFHIGEELKIAYRANPLENHLLILGKGYFSSFRANMQKRVMEKTGFFAHGNTMLITRNYC